MQHSRPASHASSYHLMGLQATLQLALIQCPSIGPDERATQDETARSLKIGKVSVAEAQAVDSLAPVFFDRFAGKLL